jgi:hypothetical protein
VSEDAGLYETTTGANPLRKHSPAEGSGADSIHDDAVEWLRERTWSFVDDEDMLVGAVVLSEAACRDIVTGLASRLAPTVPDREELLDLIYKHLPHGLGLGDAVLALLSECGWRTGDDDG